MKCWSNNFADIFTSFSSKMSKLINFSTIYHYIWKTQDGGFPPFLYLLAWLNLLIFQKFSPWVFFPNGSINIYFYWPWEIPNDSYHTSFNSSTKQFFHVLHYKIYQESYLIYNFLTPIIFPGKFKFTFSILQILIVYKIHK